MPRQSTTQKITRAMRRKLLWLCPEVMSEFCHPKPDCNGFIARMGGQEYAIVNVYLNHLVPCPILHPNEKWLPIEKCTVRKGLPLTDRKLSDWA